MHARNTITYVRYYVRPDPYITFTWNPACVELQQLLFLGKLPVDGLDITVLFLWHKLKLLICGKTGSVLVCELLGVLNAIANERIASHTHLLIWLYDNIISKKFTIYYVLKYPTPTAMRTHMKLWRKNMIHRTCSTMKLNSPCMIDEN